MAKRNSAKKIDDPAVRELDAIKKLIILLLYKAGTAQSEIAKVLSMDPAEMSRMIPLRTCKRFSDND